MNVDVDANANANANAGVDEDEDVERRVVGRVERPRDAIAIAICH